MSKTCPNCGDELGGVHADAVMEPCAVTELAWLSSENKRMRLVVEAAERYVDEDSWVSADVAEAIEAYRAGGV